MSVWHACQFEQANGHNATEEINALMHNFGLYTIKTIYTAVEALIDPATNNQQYPQFCSHLI